MRNKVESLRFRQFRRDSAKEFIPPLNFRFGYRFLSFKFFQLERFHDVIEDKTCCRFKLRDVTNHSFFNFLNFFIAFHCMSFY